MIADIQAIVTILILVLLIFRFKLGLGLYMAYIILVPYLSIKLPGFSLQWNLVNLLVLILAIYNFTSKKASNFKIDIKPLIPFIIYFIVSLLMMPLQTDTPFDYQIHAFRAHIMQYLILPFAIWNEMRLDNSAVKLYRNIAMVCIGIAAIYGLFLTLMPGNNPYITVISLANGAEFNEEYALAEGGGRMFGRISSVFTHPMKFGLFLGLALIYVYHLSGSIKKIILPPLLLVICLDIIFCGVRSVIGGVIIALLYYLLASRNIKLFFSIGILAIIGYYLLGNIPGLGDYLGSITDVNNKNQAVAGSSIDMRLEQLGGCFREIRNSVAFGKGYSWASYYKEIHGDHPIILAFESLIYVVLCNSGLFGVVLWIFMILKTMGYNRRYIPQHKYLLNSLLFFYIAYSCITGEYGYMSLFIIFYILMLGETLLDENSCSLAGRIPNNSVLVRQRTQTLSI